MTPPSKPAVMTSPLRVEDAPPATQPSRKPEPVTWKDALICALILIGAMLVLTFFLHRP